MSRDARATVLYDDDCGFCRWTAERLRRWDRRRRLRFATIQGETGARLLGDLPPAERLASWHVVTPDGRRSAGAALAPTLERLPGGRPLALLAGAAPGLTEAAYRAVARRRTAIGRLLGTDACAVDPARARPDADGGPADPADP
ncbi:MAG TPA: DCC1-like thiol-disulfide oxidoreductase family protein [Actinomycetota bacterium]